MIKGLEREIGSQIHITPHMFRHSMATMLLEEDVDIRYIQRILGHSSITTTQIYTHVTSSKQKEILRIKHPRNKIQIK
jgi:site-specific recombinase XerD